MKPKFRTATKAVRQVMLGMMMSLAFVYACTILSVMV